MNKNIKKIIAFVLVAMMTMSTGFVVFASPAKDIDTDVLDFYASENMSYYDYIPEALSEKYQETIKLADLYLSKLYGNNAMLSTDENFTLDTYCQGILLGLYLDLEDENIKADLKSFTNDAAQLYIKTQANSLQSSEVQITVESDKPDTELIRPMLDAGKYKANAAVAYARKWTEEGKKLSNPDYNRYDNDCTNFVSQVLHENGVPEVDGPRKEDSSWYYEWGLIARPSYTWAGAHNFYMHLRDHSSNIERVTSTADLKVGDIISYDIYPDDGTFHIGHTVVITKKEGNAWKDIYLTYHTTDREDYPASKLIDAGYLPYAWTIN